MHISGLISCICKISPQHTQTQKCGSVEVEHYGILVADASICKAGWQISDLMPIFIMTILEC